MKEGNKNFSYGSFSLKNNRYELGGRSWQVFNRRIGLQAKK